MTAKTMTVLQQTCQVIASPEMQEKFAQALPPGVSVDRFTRVALTAIQQNPSIVEKDRSSLYNACVKAAADGLMPDGREGALVAYGEKVQWMPMVAGLIKRLAQAGIGVTAQVVCENDEFEEVLGDDGHIIHKKPKLGVDRGAIIGAYAIARDLKTGRAIDREVMDKADIEVVRSVSRNKNGDLWVKWYGEACRKTVIRRLFKRLPILDPAFEVPSLIAEEELDDEPAPTAPAAPTRTRAAAAVLAQDDEVPPMPTNDSPLG